MSSPMTKKIRSQSPDTTVAVGKGESMEEFECYKFVLAFASPFFDAMLSTNMSEKNSSRIELPDKDPEEWKLFYTFIDPSMIGNANHDATITEDVAMKLVPLFHEFQMESYVNKCDNVLSEKVKTLSHLNADAKPNAGLWDKDRIMKRTPAYRREALTRRRNAFDGIIELLQFACIYDLPITKIRAESCICFLLHELLLETIDLFDLQKVKSLVQLTLPLNEVEIKCRKQFVSLGKSEILWDFLTEKNFEWRLSGLTLEDINNNAMLPSLVCTFMEFLVQKLEVGKANKSLSGNPGGVPSIAFGSSPGFASSTSPGFSFGTSSN